MNSTETKNVVLHRIRCNPADVFADELVIDKERVAAMKRAFCGLRNQFKLYISQAQAKFAL